LIVENNVKPMLDPLNGLYPEFAVETGTIFACLYI